MGSHISHPNATASNVGSLIPKDRTHPGSDRINPIPPYLIHFGTLA